MAIGALRWHPPVRRGGAKLEQPEGDKPGFALEDVTNHLTATATPVGGAGATTVAAASFGGAQGRFHGGGFLELRQGGLGGQGLSEDGTCREQKTDDQDGRM